MYFLKSQACKVYGQVLVLGLLGCKACDPPTLTGRLFCICCHSVPGQLGQEQLLSGRIKHRSSQPAGRATTCRRKETLENESGGSNCPNASHQIAGKDGPPGNVFLTSGSLFF